MIQPSSSPAASDRVAPRSPRASRTCRSRPHRRRRSRTSRSPARELRRRSSCTVRTVRRSPRSRSAPARHPRRPSHCRTPKTDTTYVMVRQPRRRDLDRVARPPAPARSPRSGPPAATPRHDQSRVTGHGTARRLTYSVSARAGLSVSFAERSHRTYHLLGRAAGTHGTLRFTPAARRGRSTRTIDAIVSDDGVQREIVAVTSYRAPRPITPGRVHGLQLRRRGRRFQIRFGSATGASYYLLTVRGTDGRHLLRLIGKTGHSLTLPVSATTTTCGSRSSESQYSDAADPPRANAREPILGAPISETHLTPGTQGGLRRPTTLSEKRSRRNRAAPSWRPNSPEQAAEQTPHDVRCRPDPSVSRRRLRATAFVLAPARDGSSQWRPSHRSGSWHRTTPSPRRRSHTLDADDTTVGCDLVSAYGLSTGPSQRSDGDRPPHAFRLPPLPCVRHRPASHNPTAIGQCPADRRRGRTALPLRDRGAVATERSWRLVVPFHCSRVVADAVEFRLAWEQK